ncbi:ribonuclease H-like protein [Basidiobolus meristosporus CBS 931.73]|uniref:3'-5' exonuclease n=1 Tax=Basidiobolus meristosporus CBS 931.73 TaxID=1314790 RepID=A0A1Y1WSD2_9FUNG|nr:ribonuclease H-like protein [Basidiobolus meristosporus CBS 931.73]|eukprot:ORX76437.1 ribonuclease H-like protein [Basidiobolus meristosporus CBS 931.73]
MSRTLPSRWYSQPSSSPHSVQLPILDYAADPTYKIHYMKSAQEANTLIEGLQGKVFALDIEWRVRRFTSLGKTALVQLCDNHGVYLFHIHHMREFPIRLRELLEDPYILKPGCNIRGDGTKLFKDYGVESRSLLELGSLGIQVSDQFNGRKIQKLTTLVEILLQRSMKKEHNIALSNWEVYKLSADQINYAGNDVYVGYKLFEQIRKTQLEKSEQKYWMTLYNISSNTQVFEVERSLEGQLVICNNPQQNPVASITSPNWDQPVLSIKRKPSKQELEADPEVKTRHPSLLDLQSAFFKHEKLAETGNVEPPATEDFQKEFCQAAMDSWSKSHRQTRVATKREDSMLKQSSSQADLEKLARHTQIYQESINYSHSWSSEMQPGGGTEADQLTEEYLKSWSIHRN